MRVLHVGSGNMYGGVEAMLTTLARHRDACPDMAPEFALCFEGRLSSELREAGVPVHVLGPVRASRPTSVWRARRALRDVLRRGAFDAAVCHAPWPHAVFAPAVRALGVPSALWVHGPLTGRHWVERWAARTVPDVAICNSAYTAGTLASVFPTARRAVVYCPVAPPAPGDAGDVAFVREEFDTSPDDVVVVQASRMEALKGHELLLAALGAMRDDPRWVCWLVGGAQRPEEARYVRQLRAMASDLWILDRVRFVGQRSDVPRVLAAADVFCQPNTGPEGFGISFVEAMGAGLPVVTTAIGAGAELVDMHSGVVVPPADPDALGDTLRRLVADPDFRRELSGAAPARAAQLCDPGDRLRDLHAVLGTLGGARVHEPAAFTHLVNTGTLASGARLGTASSEAAR